MKMYIVHKIRNGFCRGYKKVDVGYGMVLFCTKLTRYEMAKVQNDFPPFQIAVCIRLWYIFLNNAHTFLMYFGSLLVHIYNCVSIHLLTEEHTYWYYLMWSLLFSRLQYNLQYANIKHTYAGEYLVRTNIKQCTREAKNTFVIKGY